MITITDISQITKGMSVRPKGGRYDWVVYNTTETMVYFQRYSDSKGLIVDYKSARSIARGELRTHA